MLTTTGKLPIVTVLAAACMLAYAVSANAETIPFDPDSVTGSNVFPEDSLMRYAVEDPDIQEMVNRMDTCTKEDGLPDYYEAEWEDSDDLPGIAHDSWGSIVDMYNGLADIRIVGRGPSEILNGPDKVIVTFMYDDICPLFYFITDGDDIYFAGDGEAVKVEDPNGILESVKEEQEKEQEKRGWLDGLDGAVFKAREENWNLTDGSSDSVAETEYAVMEDGTVYTRELRSHDGYGAVQECRMKDGDFEEFSSLIGKLKGHSENHDGADGFGWHMWRPGGDGKPVYEFYGYTDSDKKLVRITELLEKYRTFIIY